MAERRTWLMAERFTDEQMYVVAWAAKECARQHSDEQSVLWMVRGWNLAMEGFLTGRAPVELDIMALGAIVEPRRNAGGYRLVNVRVGSDVKMDWRQVPKAMENLLGAVEDIDAHEWFYRYETIHPFRDGNGRTGAILWNWLNGTLGTPQEPPEYWGPREEIAL